MPNLIELIRDLEVALSGAVATARLAYDSGQHLCLAAKDRRAAEAHDYILDQNEIATQRASNLMMLVLRQATISVAEKRSC